MATPMMEHICDNLWQFSGEIRDSEELDKIFGGCLMGNYICKILNTYNEVNR